MKVQAVLSLEVGGLMQIAWDRPRSILRLRLWEQGQCLSCTRARS